MHIDFKLGLVLGHLSNRLRLKQFGNLGERLNARLQMLFIIIKRLAFCFKRSCLTSCELGGHQWAWKISMPVHCSAGGDPSSLARARVPEREACQ